MPVKVGAAQARRRRGSGREGGEREDAVEAGGAAGEPEAVGAGGRSRIQERNRALILEAALAVFSAEGFKGATLDRIAKAARLSKPNLLYYFPSKEAIHLSLLEGLLDAWLAPLAALDPAGEPLEEVRAYVRAKLALARDFPRESRLFAGEVLRGAPHLAPVLGGRLAALVEDKAEVLQAWMDAGSLAPVPPKHLLFAVWALTQHYADFEAQVRAVLGPGHDPFAEAGPVLDMIFARLLAPPPAPPPAPLPGGPG